LNVVSPVHITTWGNYITTPKVTEKEAVINIKTSVVNQNPKVSKNHACHKNFRYKRAGTVEG